MKTNSFNIVLWNPYVNQIWDMKVTMASKSASNLAVIEITRSINNQEESIFIDMKTNNHYKQFIEDMCSFPMLVLEVD